MDARSPRIGEEAVMNQINRTASDGRHDLLLPHFWLRKLGTAWISKHDHSTSIQ
ncbi:hypothetical protein KIN20_002848 [Parelaphostrongylus tenuis]|uniref:Uncharacterized protein n=1 Tax=Parelaphostrongylus tenuis TaxID=148309 RepID=A0AAD5MHE6_PARTN|nr:hypothetical protein KIN20_002848 [Parelaphostrongylus tenuis]